MNLLNMLLQTMTSGDSVESLSQNYGASGNQVSGLLSAALPMLLSSMTGNAQSADGASSLLGALSQHTSTEPISAQIQNADTADGSAILGHIFGGEMSEVVSQLSGETGLDESQVSGILSSVAPAMMSGVSAAATAAAEQPSQGTVSFDTNSADTASDPASSGFLSGLSGLTGMLGSLFGGADEKEEEPAAQDTSAFDGSALLNLLLKAK